MGIAAREAHSSAIGNAAQMPATPKNCDRQRLKGRVMINCLNREIARECFPIPKDSNTPE